MSNGPKILITIEERLSHMYVQEYTYLGQQISFQDKMEKEIQRRITLARREFWALKFIILDHTVHTLSRTNKFNTLKVCVYPVLLYGCQTWTLTSKLKNKIGICQRKMQRKILGVTRRDRIPNTVLRQRALAQK
ncbi:hypothetical protein C0J52_00905 [Blattella germanica]|nr:hypothetical protein C0J52_00905 [Blattella germanica]